MPWEPTATEEARLDDAYWDARYDHEETESDAGDPSDDYDF